MNSGNENEDTGAELASENVEIVIVDLSGEGDGDDNAAAGTKALIEVEDDDDIFYSSPDAGSSDPFLSKLFVNLMLNYKPNHSYDTIIREMITRLPGNVYHREWIKAYNAGIDLYRAEHPENKFILTREAFDPDEIVSFGRLAEETLDCLEFPISKSALLLADILELTPIETLFAQFSMKMSQNMAYEFHALFEQFRYSDLGDNPPNFYSVLFGISEEDASTALKGFLFQSGLLTHEGARHKPFYYVNQDMREAFCSPHLSVESLTEQLFPSNISTELTMADYPHLATPIERAEKIIGAGLIDKVNEDGTVEKKRGINLMFWGIPGTGKTELAIMLAKKNGWNLRVIGDINDADNKEKSRAERLVSLKIALKLYGRDTNTVLLFDEMEDLFKMDTNAAFSKAFVNRIIETTTVPIIWTTNELPVIGNAVLRRMIYNIAFEVPPVDARRSIWQRYTDKYDLGIESETLDDLAETYDTAPALIHNAAKITSMAGLESKELPEIVQSLDRLVNYGEKRKFMERVKQDDTYDISCVNTDTDLVKLTDCLMTSKPSFSVLLYGAPGTGKSEYGRHIAKRLKKRFMYKRASDLTSMWVGETEKLIAAAFERAHTDEALLLIDEGDSFLRNREHAKNSWEVTQVNELLSQMERHDQPFILTTNLMSHLDPAAMRRFTFKMKFNFLRPEQSVRLFERYFGHKAPHAIERMPVLTPGDFANVKRRADIIGVTDAQKLLDMLHEECAVKPNRAGTIGFR